jgi:hypothetical protein
MKVSDEKFTQLATKVYDLKHELHEQKKDI